MLRRQIPSHNKAAVVPLRVADVPTELRSTSDQYTESDGWGVLNRFDVKHG